MSAETTPRVWIGCLGCYIAGHLIGAWFDATEAPQDMDAWERLVTMSRGAINDHQMETHEELWVMDHEGFDGLLKGECSPATAKELADVLASVDEREAFASYVDQHLGVSYAAEDWDAAKSAFEDAWCGWWDTEADYAQDLAEDVVEGLEDTAARWPYSCIDWNGAWRELDMGGDNFSVYSTTRHEYAIFRTT